MIGFAGLGVGADGRPGYAGLVIDRCHASTIHRRGIGPSAIARIPLFHNTYGDFGLPPAFHASVAVLNEKWHDLGMIPTLNGNFGAPP